jgi:hypothetical protein
MFLQHFSPNFTGALIIWQIRSRVPPVTSPPAIPIHKIRPIISAVPIEIPIHAIKPNRILTCPSPALRIIIPGAKAHKTGLVIVKTTRKAEGLKPGLLYNRTPE